MNTMSYAQAPIRTFKHIFDGAILTGFSRLVARIRREMVLRAAISQLQRLDDRCLADMGVIRSDIERVVRG